MEVPPMRSGLTDTSPAAEQVQIELLRQAGLVRRVDLAVAMTNGAIEAAYAALHRRHPEANELEIRLLFVELHYGLALATRLRAALIPAAGTHGPLS